ncbi:MAG: hypothetical protein IKO56_05760, partial [Alphaproteobacteria bacterium]|nr:hypothetical protein [Alphaproteobacteria bacterium]
NKNNVVKECKASSDGYFKCETPSVRLLDIQFKKGSGGSVSFNDIFKSGNTQDTERRQLKRYQPATDVGADLFKAVSDENVDEQYYEVASAKKASGNAILAYAVISSGSLQKLGGYKVSEWDTISNQAKYYYRNSDGSVGSEITEDKEKIRFSPNSRNASDGGLVDLSNQARLKGTLAGTAAGGALGGFAGYEGAKTEVSERWVAAVREYKDSLSNFVCVTGQRFLSQYNDDAIIPSLQQSNK